MKVVCSMVVSVDGFIADGKGQTVSSAYNWQSFFDSAKKYNNFVVGRKTFDLGGFDNVKNFLENKPTNKVNC